MSDVPDGFTLVFEDAALLVLDKPSGLLCVPGRGDDKRDCLSARVQAQFPDALIVHRLDMATSGLVLMARGPDSQRRISAAFEARQVAKRYTARVAGAVEVETDKWSTIELPIAADWPNRPRQIVDPIYGKPSITRWRRAAFRKNVRGDPSSRVELEPLTGRTHQLRVHMAAIGHPILGDTLYAADPFDFGVTRLMLHATTLRLAHPQSGQALNFESLAPF